MTPEIHFLIITHACENVLCNLPFLKKYLIVKLINLSNGLLAYYDKVNSKGFVSTTCRNRTVQEKQCRKSIP